MKIIQDIKKFFFDRSVEGRLKKTQEMSDEISDKIIESRQAHTELKKQIQAMPESADKAMLLQVIAMQDTMISENEAFLAQNNMRLHILKTTKFA